MKKILILLLMLITIAASSQKKKEVYFQLIFANAMYGDTEVVLEDRTRVDIHTDTFAIEVDFAKKWSESIGQSLYYSEMTNKKAGVLLIIEGEKEKRYLDRLMKVAIKHDITVWVIDYNSDVWKRVDVVTTYSY